jgi:hypothetical protein
MPHTVDVTVRVDKAHAARLDEVVHALKVCGLKSVERHERFLIVNGSVEAEQLEALRNVEGVASVREDKTYRAKAQSPRR